MPLLLLHSSSGSSRVYRRITSLLSEFDCIAPDLPGFGESDAMHAGARIEDVATQVLLFLDELNVSRFSIFGVHSGNKIAAAVADARPDRIDRLVIAGITHSLVLDAAERRAAMLSYAGRKEVPNPPTDYAWHQLQTKLLSVLQLQLPSVPNAAPDLERLTNEMLDLLQTQQGVDAMYAANVSFDLAASLKRIKARTLVIELRIPAESYLQPQGPLIAGLMADCRSATLEGNDRDLLQQRPAQLAGLLRGFLS